MNNSKILVLLCVLAFAALQGCAGKMLPYEDSFECPQADKGMCTNVAGAYKVALKEDPESSYSQKAATGKTGKREMENALEAYQLAVQSGNDDAIILRGQPLLKLLAEQEAPSATKTANDYADTSNVGTKKRILARTAKTLEALIASDNSAAVPAYDPYLGLPTDDVPLTPVSGQPALQGQTAAPQPPLGSVELYVAPYDTGFGAQAGGRTLFISEEKTSAAPSEGSAGKRAKQEIGTVNHPE